jgi:hypothetical protein
MRCCPYCNSEVTREGLVKALAKTLNPTDRRIIEFIWANGPVSLFAVAEEICGARMALKGEAYGATKSHIYRIRSVFKRHGLNIENVSPPGPNTAQYQIRDWR